MCESSGGSTHLLFLSLVGHIGMKPSPPSIYLQPELSSKTPTACHSIKIDSRNMSSFVKQTKKDEIQFTVPRWSNLRSVNHLSESFVTYPKSNCNCLGKK